MSSANVVPETQQLTGQRAPHTLRDANPSMLGKSSAQRLRVAAIQHGP